MSRIARWSDQIRHVLADYGILLILAALGIYFTVVTRDHIFISPRNLLNISQQVAVNMVLAIGLTFVILSGGIDLSVGAVLAVGAVFSTTIVTQGLTVGGVTVIPHLAPPMAVPVAVAATLLLGALMGAWNGLLITRLGAAPFIATLAWLAIARGGALKFTQARPISGLPEEFTRLGGGATGEILRVPLSVWIMGLLFLAGHLLLTRTRFGRQVYAVGGNEEAARLSGVAVRRIKMAVYTLSAMLASLAGVLLAARVNSGDPTLGVGFELNAIAAVVLGGTSLSGGRGSMIGTLLGALVIGVLDNGLSLQGVQEFDKQVLSGAALLLAILLDRLKRQ